MDNRIAPILDHRRHSEHGVNFGRFLCRSTNIGFLKALRIDASNRQPAAVAISRPPCVKVAGTPHPLASIVCIVEKIPEIALPDDYCSRLLAA